MFKFILNQTAKFPDVKSLDKETYKTIEAIQKVGKPQEFLHLFDQHSLDYFIDLLITLQSKKKAPEELTALMLKLKTVRAEVIQRGEVI